MYWNKAISILRVLMFLSVVYLTVLVWSRPRGGSLITHRWQISPYALHQTEAETRSRWRSDVLTELQLWQLAAQRFRDVFVFWWEPWKDMMRANYTKMLGVYGKTKMQPDDVMTLNALTVSVKDKFIIYLPSCHHRCVRLFWAEHKLIIEYSKYFGKNERQYCPVLSSDL